MARTFSGYGLSGSGISIQGNRVGTNAAGTAALPNGECGIELSGRGVTIGGTAPGAGNLISGNTGPGIQFGIDYYVTLPADDNVAMGNVIGMDVTGTNPLGNGVGVLFIKGSNNTLGGVAVGAGNRISGNLGAGVAGVIGLYGAGVSGNQIRGNSISDNLNWRCFVNITHLVTTIPEDKPSEEALFGGYWAKYGK